MKKWDQRRTKRKSKRVKMSKSKSKSRSSRSKSRRLFNKKGGAPSPSYVGSIQGEFINDRGQQLFRNPVGGIA
jgi:hypothetical protein